MSEQRATEACPFCDEPLDAGSVRCGSCGAYGLEKEDEVVWYRKGDSPERQRLFRIIPAVVTLLIVLISFVVVTRVISAADSRADRLVECREQGIPRSQC